MGYVVYGINLRRQQRKARIQNLYQMSNEKKIDSQTFWSFNIQICTEYLSGADKIPRIALTSFESFLFQNSRLENQCQRVCLWKEVPSPRKLWCIGKFLFPRGTIDLQSVTIVGDQLFPTRSVIDQKRAPLSDQHRALSSSCHRYQSPPNRRWQLGWFQFSCRRGNE